MAAVLPSIPVHRVTPHRPRWSLALPGAAIVALAVAGVIVLAVIPPVRDIWVKEARGAELAVPALWAAALANAAVAGLLAAAWWSRGFLRPVWRWLLIVLGLGAFLQALALFDASAALEPRDNRLDSAVLWSRLAALGDAVAGLLMLSATLRPLQRLWGWLARVLPVLAFLVLFVVLLAAGPWLLAAALTLVLGVAVLLFAWRIFDPGTAPRLPGLPASQPGRWSAWLLSGFALCFALFLWAVTLGARGGETFFSNPLLAVSLLAASCLAVVGGVVAAVAVISRRERSPLVIVALGLGVLVTVFALGELLAPH